MLVTGHQSGVVRLGGSVDNGIGHGQVVSQTQVCRIQGHYACGLEFGYGEERRFLRHFAADDLVHFIYYYSRSQEVWTAQMLFIGIGEGAFGEVLDLARRVH